MKVFYMGGVGFPQQIGAEVSKQKLVAQALANSGCKVFVVNRRPSTSTNKEFITGHYGKICYTNASGIGSRPANFLLRNYYKFRGALGEFVILKKGNADVIVSNTRIFSLVLFYWIISKLLKVKLCLTYVEYASKMQERQKINFKINDYLFEKLAFKLIDGVFPISEILKNIALQSNPKIKWMKLPVLVDFKQFENPHEFKSDYFLYCGAASYAYAIQLILDAYKLIEDKAIKLVLVLYGSKSAFCKVDELLKISKIENNVKILKGLEYSELISYYQNALGLLIPLKRTIQDEARFPQKIAEYAAAARPIITTNFGEIKYYFTHGKNALVAHDDIPALIAEQINFVLRNRDEATQIGKNGFVLAQKYFDYEKIGIEMVDFLKSLTNQKK